MMESSTRMRSVHVERGTGDDLDAVMEVMETAFGDRYGEAWTRSQCAGILPMTGVSLMLFYVFAMQCMSTLAIVRRETRSWKWPIIQLVYMTGLAYLMSFIAYQILK